MIRFFILTLLLLFSAGAQSAPRVISLGFDGIDPVLAQKYMDEGHLPNLKKLADGGGFATLDTVVPSQSPVCWSSMLNGTNPGKHGVMGFVKRNEHGYAPTTGLVIVEDRQILLGKTRHWLAPLGVVLLFALLGFLINFAKRPKEGQEAKSRFYRPVMGLLIALPLAGLIGWASQELPTDIKAPANVRQGPSYFEILAEEGHQVAALNTPMDWPLEQRDNVLEYAGFNIPDLRGSFGIYSFYTDAYNAGEFVKSEMGADVYRVDLSRGRAQAEYLGPRDIMKPDEGFPETKLYLNLHRSSDREHLTISVVNNPINTGFEHWDGGQAHLKPGEWSEWLDQEFELSKLVTIKGRMRFYLESLEPELRLYATPIQFDPAEPAGGNNIASPVEYFPQINELVGGIDTLGWPELTHPMYDNNLRDKAFMEHLLDLEGKRAKILYDVLEKDKHDCVSAWFFGPDRVQHMMYRYIDPENPNYELLQKSEHRNAIRDVYIFMDQVVGEVLEKHCGEDTTLLIMSDHGFSPFNRAVSINRWLLDEGYLVLKGEQQQRHASDMFNQKREALLTEVDWSKTKAYALGLGKIFLNVKGREPEGIVEASEREALSIEIRDKLMQLRDPERENREVLNHIYLRDDIAWGDYATGMADLVVGFKRGYRVSWQTTLGYANEPIIFDNDKTWSGDHCSIDPALIPGSLFANRKLPERAKLWDLCPTILAEFGIAAKEDMDGKAIELLPLETKE